MKNIKVFFLSKNVPFLEMKFSIYLNRRVFVMSKCCLVIFLPSMQSVTLISANI